MTASAIAELASMFSFSGPDASAASDPDPSGDVAGDPVRDRPASHALGVWPCRASWSRSRASDARQARRPVSRIGAAVIASRLGGNVAASAAEPAVFATRLGSAVACDLAEGGLFSTRKPRSTRLLDVGRWLVSALHAPVLLLFCLLFSACRQTEVPGELRKLEAHGLQLETPAGWTGGEAGGTYEYHSPDGSGRLRIARLEGATAVSALKDAQMLAGTGTTPSSRPFPLSPTKIGGLPALRARYGTKDGRLYEVIALQMAGQAGGPASVVLIQIGVAVDAAERSESAADKVIGTIRQSIRPLEGGPGGFPDGGSLPVNSNLTPIERSSPPTGAPAVSP